MNKPTGLNLLSVVLNNEGKRMMCRVLSNYKGFCPNRRCSNCVAARMNLPAGYIQKHMHDPWLSVLHIKTEDSHEPEELI